MKRILPPLLAALLVSVAWILPDVADARLAALEAHAVLGHVTDEAQAAADAEAEASGEEVAPRTLADQILDGPTVRPREGGDETELELTLHGVVIRAPADPTADVLSLHIVARRSIVRGLREAAQARGKTLHVFGEQAPSMATEGGAVFEVRAEEGSIAMTYAVDGNPQPVGFARMPWTPPSRPAVLPPLIAIALAVLIRRPLPALLLGVLAGAFLIERMGGAGVGAALKGAPGTFYADLLLPELRDSFRYEIVLFVIFMLAMVGVVTRNGGVRGVMERIARLAGSARGSQAAAYVMGLAVFFDDYANTILVGSTMRPLTDRWRVSREKLAYLIDSTAAPVAGLAVLSTWIAFEVSTFSAQLPAAGLTAADGYAVFLQSLPYRFYCVLTLVFVGAIAFSGRDFGTMLSAERRARRTGQLVREGGRPMVSEQSLAMDPAPGVMPRAFAAVLPILTFIGVTLWYIAWTGGAFGEEMELSIEGLTNVLYNGSGSAPLMYGSGAGLLLAVVISLGLRLGAVDILTAALRVVRGMGVAILILYLAWMIGRVCGELGTAPYLTAMIGDSLDARLLPAVLFILAGFVAFATGSSWSTMSILLPIVVGLAYSLGQDAGLAESAAASGMVLMLMSIGAVLEGAIFGDHCSPISDTTVLSSIAASSDHVDHVRTQIPYAVTTMLLAMATGYLPCAFYGLSPWVGLLIGAAAAIGFVLIFGRRADDGSEATGADA